MDDPAHRPVTICGTRLDRPRHVCCFFDSRDQQYDILAPYIAEGLANREKVMCVLDRCDIDAHHHHLDARGLSCASARESGHLCTHASEDTYLQAGWFGRVRMLEMLHQELLRTASHGFTALRTAGDMSWLTRNMPSVAEAMQYESDVNELLKLHDATFLCIYDVNNISGAMMRDILNTHSHVLMGNVVYQNQYYMPPEEYRSTLPARRGATANVMGEGIAAG